MKNSNSKNKQKYYSKKKYNNSNLGTKDHQRERDDLIKYAKSKGVPLESLSDFLNISYNQLMVNLNRGMTVERMVKYYKAIDELSR